MVTEALLPQSINMWATGKRGDLSMTICLIDKIARSATFSFDIGCFVISFCLNYNDFCGYQKPLYLSTLTTIFFRSIFFSCCNKAQYAAMHFFLTHTHPPTHRNDRLLKNVTTVNVYSLFPRHIAVRFFLRLSICQQFLAVSCVSA